jgi:dTDP-4-dehydrorhamnose 3,5-epimerase
MNFTSLQIPGAFLVEPRPIEDERGFFARAWCEIEMREHGCTARIRQTNMAFNRRRGTLRGLHYQTAPHDEAKFIRCVRGAIFDVIVDLRPESPSFRSWFGVELTQDNRRALFVPEGCATGYLTLVDDVEIFYDTSALFERSAARGVKFDDPAFGIQWPSSPTLISEQDRTWPAFSAHSGT